MNRILVLLIVIGTLGSCTQQLSPFTSRVQKEAQLGEAQLKKVQFYVSHDIVIQRELGADVTEITNGEIKILNGRKIEEVVIPAGTPGVLVKMPNESKLAVSFESNDSFLMFGRNVRKGGVYTLMAKDWSYKVGKVTYEGQTFKTDPESAGAFLMVDIKKLNEFKRESRTATGRTIDG